MLARPDSRRRECEEELRWCREANITLADVDGGAETVGRGAVGRSTSFLSSSVVAAVRGLGGVVRQGELRAAQNASSSLNRAA
eukprot:5290567-Pleurochrysis_carterae.AAC.1